MNNDIINNLFSEFEYERDELKIKYEDNSLRIEAINENIKELNQYDDDRQMFSPRNIMGINSEKVEELKKEKESLLEENSFISSRLKYFESKVDALEEVLQESEKEDKNSSEKSEENVDDNSSDKSTVDKSQNNNDGYENKSENITEKKEDDKSEGQKISEDNIKVSDKKNSTDNSENTDLYTGENLNLGKSKLKKIIYRLELALKLMDTNTNRSKNEIKSVIHILSNELSSK